MDLEKEKKIATKICANIDMIVEEINGFATFYAVLGTLTQLGIRRLEAIYVNDKKD